MAKTKVSDARLVALAAKKNSSGDSLDNRATLRHG